MKELEARLKLALQYIADAEAIVERQRERAAKLTVEGRLSADAVILLDTYIANLNILHDHAQRLREELYSM